MINNAILSAMAWVADVRSTVAGARRTERGQGLTEYAVLVGAIVLIAAAAFALTPISLNDFRKTIQGCLDFEAGACK